MSTEPFTPAVFPRFGAEAEAERQRARRRGYADGHADGFRAGSAEAAAAAAAHAARREESDARVRAETASALAALDAARGSVIARAHELTTVTEQQLSARAIELAELILAESLADGEFAALTALRRGLAAMRADLDAEIRLSPDDLRVLTLRDALPAHVSVTADESLSNGDAVVVVDDGLVDARIDAALERARTALDEGAR